MVHDTKLTTAIGDLIEFRCAEKILKQVDECIGFLNQQLAIHDAAGAIPDAGQDHLTAELELLETSCRRTLAEMLSRKADLLDEMNEIRCRRRANNGAGEAAAGDHKP